MRLAMIWAMTRNRVIGADGGLPWRLPDEMRHFVKTTLGKPVIMGRRTFESMDQPLPRRTNIVLTRSPEFQVAKDSDVRVEHDLTAALRLAEQVCKAQGSEEAVIIGGAEIYALGLPVADRLYETVIDAELKGDTTFPPYDADDWLEQSCVTHPADDRHAFAYTTRMLERIR